MKKNLSQDKQTEVEQRDFVQQEDTFVRKQSIQQEITSGVASIMGLVATIAAIIVFIIGRYYIIHDASERYEDIANSGALLVQQSLSERAVFLQQLSENATLQKSFSSNNPKLMDDPIKKYMEEFPDIEGIWFLNPEGKVFAYNSSRAENNINWGNLVHKNFLGDEWFYKCKVSKDVSFFPEKMGINTEDTSLPKNIFFWTQPVSGGCIVLFENTILVSQDVFSRITHIRKNQKMKSIQAHVMSNDGLVLFSSDSDWNKYILNKDKSNPVAQYIKFAPLGSEREAFNAKQVMFSWSNIKDHISAQDNLLWNGSVVIQVDMSEVFKPLYYLIFMLIGLVIFVTSVSSFISYSRSKKLVHIPISDLEEVMEKISSGDLSMQDIKIDHNDDIGYFAFNLNKMVVKFRTMLILIVQSGKDVVHEGRQFFVNLGNLQNSSVRIGNLIKDATLNLNNIKNASEEIFFDATKQQDLVEKNKIAMQNLEKSFDQSADKRLEITRSARNVAQKSNTGLQTIDEFAKNVQKIADSSKKIKGIINLIDDVSDQTNLLALNASIEAARAGVHGHGFSVVANEISELAKRSAKSAEEISVLIKETVQQVLDVSNKVESARSIFKQIAQMMESLDKEIVEMANYTSRQQIDVTDTGGRVQTVVDISRKISERTKEQSEVSENLLKIMEQIDHLAVENRDEIEKDDQMLQGFMGKIQDLIETANQFKVSSAILSLDTNENKDMEKSDNKSILEVHSVT